jgi:hypothetical protein
VRTCAELPVRVFHGALPSAVIVGAAIWPHAHVPIAALYLADLPTVLGGCTYCFMEPGTCPSTVIVDAALAALLNPH